MDIFDLLKKNNVFEEIVNNSKLGVNIIDSRGILVYSNKVSANYVNSIIDEMVGNHIVTYYPEAILMEVLNKKISIEHKKILHSNGKKYLVDAYPIIKEKRLIGGYAVFEDITILEKLNEHIEYLETKINSKDLNAFPKIIGANESLSSVIKKSKRTVASLGGPRHCVITGESGTGKTMFAKSIYNYAKKIGIISQSAPFIEINCAQFTNPDIAAIEIFGCKEGAYTGAKDKKGLFELANDGYLFLDEAHTLKHYQNLLLKAIESGTIRRIGGVKDISVNVIVIAASTMNLKEVLLPELYQRLAQYELKIPALRERSNIEKTEILDYFTKEYEKKVKKQHDVNLKITFSKKAEDVLIRHKYPRNIRQFRDVINATIDASVPLITNVSNLQTINNVINLEHIAFDLLGESTSLFEETLSHNRSFISNKDEKIIFNAREKNIDKFILQMHSQGLGARRIAKRMQELGYDLKYYQVTYKLKKLSKNKYT